MNNENLFLFLDESGDYNFSDTGTKYLVFTCITTTAPTHGVAELYDLKHSFIENGLPLEYFHASEDKQMVRDSVFQVIQQSGNFVIDSIIVEKCKVNPSIRDIHKIYLLVYEKLLQYVCNRYSASQIDRMIIFTDRMPVQKRRKMVEKAFKTNIKVCIPSGTQHHHILHHDSKSHFYLQIADYCCWAIYRKWNNSDPRSYDIVQDKIISEFDIFAVGNKRYY